MNEDNLPSFSQDEIAEEKLSSNAIVTGAKADGSFSKAPLTVKLAQIMNIICVIMGVIWFVNGALVAREPGGVVAWFIQTVMGVTYIMVGAWLLNSVRWGEKNAHKAQLSLAALSIFCVPVGTALSVFVFAGWNKPDVKAWFGIEE